MTIRRSKIRVGIIGCGQHAREVILPTLLLSPDVQIVALYDPNLEYLIVAKESATTACLAKSCEEICDDPSIDAVVVVASPQIHFEAATRALRQGKHVFVEKPLAANGDLAARLAAVAESSQRITMVGHNFRFAPAVERIKAVMADHAFGRRSLISIQYLASKPRGDRWGLGSFQRSFLLSHGSHAIDIAVDLLGNDLAVEHVAMQDYGESSFTIVTLRTPSGEMCTLSLTNGAPHFDVGVTVVGSNGALIQMNSLREVRNFGDADHFKRIGIIWVPPTLAVGFSQAGYAGEMAQFIGAIRSGKKCSPSFSDAVCVYQIIDQILEKIHSTLDREIEQ